MLTTSTTHGFYSRIFAWTVEIPFEDIQRRSNTFSFKGHKVYLRFFVFGSDNYCVALQCLPSFPVCTISDMTVRVETKNKTPLPFPNNRRIDPPNNITTFWCYSKNDILAAYPDFYKEGVLTFLVFDVDVDPPKQANPVPKKEKSVQTNDVSSCLENLSTDYSRLLQDPDSRPDVQLKCGDRIIRVHGPVLTARSKVLSAMLKSDLSEGRTGQIEIKDVDCEVFDQFVGYLYTGKLPDLDVDTARGLYEVADKYDVAILMRRCSRYLEENLTQDNACEMLILADAHSDQDFKRRVADYVLKEKIPDQDEHWLAFCEGHPKLAVEVLNCSYKRRRTK